MGLNTALDHTLSFLHLGQCKIILSHWIWRRQINGCSMEVKLQALLFFGFLRYHQSLRFDGAILKLGFSGGRSLEILQVSQQKESLRSSFSVKPLFFFGFQVQAREIHMRKKRPVFSGCWIFKNSGSRHGIRAPWQFRTDRTAFIWVAILEILQWCHSTSNTWQGEGSENRSSLLTNVSPSCSEWYQYHPLDLVNGDQWLSLILHLGGSNLNSSVFFMECFLPWPSIIVLFFGQLRWFVLFRKQWAGKFTGFLEARLLFCSFSLGSGFLCKVIRFWLGCLLLHACKIVHYFFKLMI